MPQDFSSPTHAVTRLVHFFEHLSPGDLAPIDTLYAPDARFKDPFNEVQGTPAIRALFEHMFRALMVPRFVVTCQVVQGTQAFLTWDMHFRFKGDAVTRVRTVRGATHLRFDTQGRVVWHRDYWDAAEELYEQLPGVGTLMRWLKRRVQRG